MANNRQFCRRMKDYYAILSCTPMSSAADIKKQYRLLAQRYHPDKNPGDAYAAAAFQDIKEAYETLTQPDRKEAWLQERWLRQVHNIDHSETAPLTPDLILKKLLRLDRTIASMDVFRMDQVGCADDLVNILSDRHLNCLLQFNERDINQTIVQFVLSCARPLEYPYLEALWPRLLQLAEDDPELIRLIEETRTAKKRKQQQEMLTAPLVILITLLLCAMIFWVSR